MLLAVVVGEDANNGKKSGWTPLGMHGKAEVKFGMNYETWLEIRSKPLL